MFYRLKKIFLCGICVLALCLVSSCASVSVPSFPASEEQVNLNNYQIYSTFQKSGEVMVSEQPNAFGSKLHIYKSNQKLTSVLCTGRFWLQEKNLYFINYDLLYHYDVDSGTTQRVIQKPIADFLLCEAGVLYTPKNDLHWYLLYNGTEQPILSSEINEIAVNENYIFALDASCDLYRISMDLSQRDRVGTNLIYPNKMLVVDDHRVLLRDTKIYLYDIKTKKQTDIGLTPLLATDRMEFNANEKNVFVSYRASKADGSIVKFIDHPQNGTWQINLENFEKTKLSEISDSSIILYNDQNILLYGNRHHEWVDIQ